ncbi:MAG: hypothetical protein E4G94_04075 [ANME-2 cluster archaeon]|nr:MAG: hypothetical protein E4G94_04075 [ANME-2 cluster archaeon]
MSSGCIKAPKEAVLNPSNEIQPTIPVLLSELPDLPELEIVEVLPEEDNSTEYFNVSIFFRSNDDDNLSVLVEVPNSVLNSTDIKIKCNSSEFNITNSCLSDDYNSYYFDVNCTYREKGYLVFNPYNVSFHILREGDGWIKNVTKI